MKKILPGDKNINRKTNSYHICQNLSTEEAIKSEYLCFHLIGIDHQK